MSRKELIEDSEEVREAIADLQAKVANKSEIGEKEIITEDEISDDYAEDESSYNQDYSEEDQEEGDTVEESSFADDAADQNTDGASIVRAREETRRIRKEQFSEKNARASRRREDAKAGVRPNSPAKRVRRKKPSESLISLENVSMEYVKDRPALKNINLEIKKGEFVFIVGGSGSGKSTLIKLLLRELVPTTGTITVNGNHLEKLKHRKIPKYRRNIGVVFQNFRLLKDRNVYENVAFAQRIVQTPAREIKKNVPEMLAVVGLAKKYKAKPDQLSGGEQQRVALARALVNRPPILLADEPTGNLDPAMSLEIMNLLDKINKNGTTVIVVTHNDKIVNDMQKRVVTIRKGIILSDKEEGSYSDED